MKSSIQTSIDVDVPARTAYDQVTQFEEYPRLLPLLEEVVQVDPDTLRFRAKVGSKVREFLIEICEQIPDKRIAWRSLSGPSNAGVVTFHRLSAESCRLMLQVDYEPEGMLQTMSSKLGHTKRLVEKELESLKAFLEARGAATGAWRGAIPSPDERAR